eukprot:5137106-Pyramimonas_sp.AAC.1
MIRFIRGRGATAGENEGAAGPPDSQADLEGPTRPDDLPKARPIPPPPPRRPDVQDDRARDDVTESPYSASGPAASAGEEHSWYSSADPRNWSRPPRARDGAMDVGRGAAGYDPQ